MAKKASAKSPSNNPAVDEQKKRKQQAKREAKLMLEIEAAKKNLRKAEKNLSKTQALIEVHNAHLHTLETILSEIHTSYEESEVSAPDADHDQPTSQPELEEITLSSIQKNSTSSHQEP